MILDQLIKKRLTYLQGLEVAELKQKDVPRT